MCKEMISIVADVINNFCVVVWLKELVFQF